MATEALGVMSQARVRAAAVHDALEALRSFDGAGYEAALRQIPAEALQRIQSTHRLGWVGIEHDRHVPTAIIYCLGPEGAASFFRGLLQSQLQSSLFRGVFSTARRMFGMTPRGLVKAAPVAWGIAYQGFCRLKALNATPTSIRLRLYDVAPEVMGVPAYPESFRCLFSGLFDLCEVEGEIDMRVDHDQSCIDLDFSWSS